MSVISTVTTIKKYNYSTKPIDHVLFCLLSLPVEDSQDQLLQASGPAHEGIPAARAADQSGPAGGADGVALGALEDGPGGAIFSQHTGHSTLGWTNPSKLWVGA